MLLKKSQLNCNFPRWRISADSNQSSIIQWVGASLCVVSSIYLGFQVAELLLIVRKQRGKKSCTASKYLASEDSISFNLSMGSSARFFLP